MTGTAHIMPGIFTLVAIILGYGVIGQSVAAEWTCTPDIVWSDVPMNIRTQLIQTFGEEISPQGGPFNATDIIEDSTPHARFFGACHQSASWTIAVERGGITYHLQVFKFSDNVLTDKWITSVPSGGFTPSILDRPNDRP